MGDLKQGTFCMVGDPERRYREDPVRLLRAIRLMGKSNLRPTEATEKPMKKMASLLSTVSPARLFDEINKAFLQGYAQKNFSCLLAYGMIDLIFPTLPRALAKKGDCDLITCALRHTDQRFHQGKSLNPAFLLSVFLWSSFQDKIRDLKKQGVKPYVAKQMASAEVIRAQLKLLTMPRRHTLVIKEIWMFQALLEQRRVRQVRFVITQKRFRAAYDFLCMRAEIDPSLQKQATWWTEFQEASEDQRELMMQSVHKTE
jgi:poly(A) polymerase